MYVKRDRPKGLEVREEIIKALGGLRTGGGVTTAVGEVNYYFAYRECYGQEICQCLSG